MQQLGTDMNGSAGYERTMEPIPSLSLPVEICPDSSILSIDDRLGRRYSSHATLTFATFGPSNFPRLEQNAVVGNCSVKSSFIYLPCKVAVNCQDRPDRPTAAG